MSKKKKKIIPSEVNINASNIRQLLLDKLKEHKKTRKIETNPIPLLQDKTFEESCNEKEENLSISANPVISGPILNPIISNSIHANPSISENDTKDKPYGNLKNGSKPTYKMYQTQGQSHPQQIHQQQSQSRPEQNYSTQHQDQSDYTNPIILEEKEVKKTFKLGKSGKTISVLIKNNKTRKKVEDKKTEHKKTQLSTIKNYLKEKNLIRFGTTAPSKLLREMFETSELCGGIMNQNKDVLIHNFDK
jgi:hypothetical protein